MSRFHAFLATAVALAVSVLLPEPAAAAMLTLPTVAVPEPATAALIATGVAGVALEARRRKNKKDD